MAVCMQVIKYKWNNFEPYLIVNPGLGTIRLFGSEMHAVVGEKRCTGFFLGGKHFECSDKIKLDSGSQCNNCAIRDNFSLCFRCSGDKCINEKRRSECAREDYFIYLAAFDSILKVGISFEKRFLERLVEQGADFGALVGRIRDGLNVRRVEQEISSSLGIVDRVKGSEKRRMLFCNPNVAMANIKRAITKLKSDFSQYIIEPRIFDMRSYYKLHNVFFSPKELCISEKSELEGSVVAAKGNIIVLENGEFSAFNAHELLGREIISLVI